MVRSLSGLGRRATGEIVSMPLYTTQRGAVHILFLIFVLIIALAFGVLWFVATQDLDAARTAAANAQAGENLANHKFVYAEDYYRELATLVGAPVPAGLILPENPATAIAKDDFKKTKDGISEQLRAIRERVDDPSINVSQLMNSWDATIARYNTLKGDVAAKEATIARLNANIEQLNAQLVTKENERQSERTEARTEQEALVSRYTTQAGELRTQLENLGRINRDRQAEVNEAKDSAAVAARRHVEELRTKDSQVTMAKRIHTERVKDAPDGKVIAADPRTGMVFLDIGTRQMLRAGTTFHVWEQGKGDERLPKGVIQVIDVGRDRSEAKVVSQVAGADIISPGDFVQSVTFSPQEQVNFVFLGELPGRYNREMATRILEKLGAKVEPNVTVRTTYLVLGQKEDPDADELTESDDYKNAMRWGIEVIRAQDLAPFLSQ